ncbi:MAG: acylneuraminate cytidylyltransferase family protein [Candidatus Sedimenticola sp. (ex Thyasira tokunagai)]
MKKNISALIAVRSGSVRVKNKNLRKFCESNLLELKIKQLKEIDELDQIVVNSNCDEMLNIAEKNNVIAIKRDNYFSSNIVSMSEVFENMAKQIESEYIMYANCTNPLVKTQTYQSAINEFFNNSKEYDSLASCHDIKDFLYLDGKALNYDPQNQPRSQDLPNIVALNFAISIISKKGMIKNKNIIGQNPIFYKLDEVESVDIDTPLDFFNAENIYKKIMIKKDTSYILD